MRLHLQVTLDPPGQVISVLTPESRCNGYTLHKLRDGSPGCIPRRRPHAMRAERGHESPGGYRRRDASEFMDSHRDNSPPTEALSVQRTHDTQRVQLMCKNHWARFSQRGLDPPFHWGYLRLCGSSQRANLPSHSSDRHRLAGPWPHNRQQRSHPLPWISEHLSMPDPQHSEQVRMVLIAPPLAIRPRRVHNHVALKHEAQGVVDR
mmetsp:Transcript_30906/g.80139  ORF Transcript_30906/g.80139 Transcript_30906/m.80139 type:complete len:206 (-) Transcript_30906:850-1467(-)